MKTLLLIFTLALSFNAMTQIPTDGLVAYYPFNGNANDESGNNNNGAVYGAVLTTDRFGNPDRAYSFDGTDDYIQCPDPLTVNAFTLAVWIEPEGADNNRKAILTGGSGPFANGYFLYRQDQFGRFDLSQITGPASTSVIPAGKWTFIAAVSTTTELRLFIDGELENQSDASADLINWVLGIGTDFMNNNNDFLWRGKIDDIRIFDRAISPDEILDLFNEVPCTPLPTIANAGPDQVITDDTTTILQGNVPVEGTGMWTVFSGTDGILDDPSNPASTFHGPTDHSYVLCWTISNDCGSTFDKVLISFMPDMDLPVEGLVAYYPFNGNANDESGNGHNGIAWGSPQLTSDRYGNPNSTYFFDGMDDNISCGSWFTYNTFSISFWVNQAGLTGDFSDIIDNSHNFSHNWVIQSVPNSLTYSFGCSSLVGPGVYFTLMTDQWINVTCIKDSFNLKTYINGILQQEEQAAYSVPYYYQDLYIASWGGSGRYFYGMIDDIRMYDRALNESEILDLYYEEGYIYQATIYTVLNDQLVCQNDSTTFEVLAVGNPPLQFQWQKDGVDIPEASDSILLIPHVQSGDVGGYRCIATNDYGSDTSNSAMLSVEFAIPTLIMGPGNVLPYSVATYSVEIQEGHLYGFLVEGGNKIDGTENSITVQWGLTGQGIIMLTEISETGCVADTNILSVFIGYVGIDELENQNVSVYPNPVKDVASFYYMINESSEVKLQIYNSYGQQVGTLVEEYQQKGTYLTRWNTEGLITGVYFYRLSLTTNCQPSTGKLVVVR